MRFDIADRFRIDPGAGQGPIDRRALTGDARRVEAGALAAVVVGGCGTQQRIDVVAVGDRFLRALQEQYGDALAADGAVGGRVERAQVAVAGEIHAVLMHVAGALETGDAGRCDQRETPFPFEQAPMRQIQCGQRGGAVGMHEHARPLQTQLVGNHRRQCAALGHDPAHVLLDALRRRRSQQARVVGAVACRGEHSRLRHVVDAIARIFDRPPRMHEQHAQLRIHQLCIAFGDVEERRVEQFALGQRGPYRHVFRIGPHMFRHAERTKFGVGNALDTLFSLQEIGPEFLVVLRPGKRAGQADDGDAVRVVRGNILRITGSRRARMHGRPSSGGGGLDGNGVGRRRRDGRGMAGKRFEMPCDPRDRTELEHRGDVEPRLQFRGDPLGEGHGKQRSTARLEEAFVRANVVTAQRTAPHREQTLRVIVACDPLPGSLFARLLSHLPG